MRESRCTGVFPSSLSSRSTSMELCQSIQSPRIFPWELRLFQLLVNSQLERAGERPRGCCSGMAPPRTEEFRESPPTGNRLGLKKHQKTKNKPDNWKRSCKFLEKCSPRHCCSTPGSLHGWLPVFPPFLPLSQLQQHFQPLFSSTPVLYKHPGHRHCPSSNHDRHWEFPNCFPFGMQIFLPGSHPIPSAADKLLESAPEGLPGYFVRQELPELGTGIRQHFPWKTPPVFLGFSTRSCPLRNFRSSWGSK